MQLTGTDCGFDVDGNFGIGSGVAEACTKPGGFEDMGFSGGSCYQNRRAGDHLDIQQNFTGLGHGFELSVLWGFPADDDFDGGR